MRWLALVLLGSPVIAQDAATLDQSDFVAVAIDGSVNMRAGPTTEAERMTRLSDGTILRRVGCGAHSDEDWCEVETLDGATEGWVVARFLVPHAGADPLALSNAAFLPDEVMRMEDPGAISGVLEPGGIVDVPFTAPADSLVAVTLDAPAGIGSAVFAVDGTLLTQGDAGIEMAVVLPEGGDLVIRVVDTAGAGGNWTVGVRVD